MLNGFAIFAASTATVRVCVQGNLKFIFYWRKKRVSPPVLSASERRLELLMMPPKRASIKHPPPSTPTPLSQPQPMAPGCPFAFPTRCGVQVQML